MTTFNLKQSIDGMPEVDAAPGVERKLEFGVDFTAFPATPFATRPKEEVKGDHEEAARIWKGDALRICLSKGFNDFLLGDLSNFPTWQMRLEQEFSRLNIMWIMHENPSKSVTETPLLRAATALLVGALSNHIALSLKTELQWLDMQHPATLYFTLSTRWNAMAHTRRHALQQGFMNLRIGKDETMASLWRRTEDAATQLAAAGIPPTESAVVEAIIRATVGRREFEHPTNMLLSQPPGCLTVSEARRQYSAWEELTQLRRREGAALGAEVVDTPTEGGQLAELKIELAKMHKAHEELTLAMERTVNKNRSSNGAARASTVCWNCGEKGHLSRTCTKGKKDDKPK